MQRISPRSGTPGGRLWSTEHIPENERFAYWREVVCQAFTPLAPTRTWEGPFRGQVNAQRAGPGAISLISSQAQRVRRTDQLIHQRDDGVTYLNLQLKGNGTVSQDGRTAVLSPGDFALVDSTRPFELGFQEDFEQLCLTLPNEHVAPKLGIPELATARRVTGQDGLGAIIGALAQSLAREAHALDTQAAAETIAHLLALLALAVGAERPHPYPVGRQQLLHTALQEALRSLADPALSPSVVAGRVGISTNYLHRLFADQHTTFGHWLVEQRLQRCHQALAQPDDDRTIGEIARSWGFRHPAHFTRAFTTRYGLTPSQHREQARRTN